MVCITYIIVNSLHNDDIKINYNKNNTVQLYLHADSASQGLLREKTRHTLHIRNTSKENNKGIKKVKRYNTVV
jgi:hypothetical protein